MTPKWLSSSTPDEGLPRLQRRPMPDLGDKIVMLVSLRDCAPYLGVWPPVLDELAAVATRLLLVPGGPLVLGDGEMTRLCLPPGQWDTALGHFRIYASESHPGLVGDMAKRDGDAPMRLSPYRTSLVHTVKRGRGMTFFWDFGGGVRMPRKYLSSLPRPRTDAMLTGLSEGGEP